MDTVLLLRVMGESQTLRERGRDDARALPGVSGGKTPTIGFDARISVDFR
jgi:hypothetical protein